MRIALLAAAAAVALSMTAGAATKWTPDYANSQVHVDGKFGKQKTITVTFEKFSADIAFDSADLATSKIVVTVDTTSAKGLVAPDPDNYTTPTNSYLPGAGWLNSKAFPKAVFTSTSIVSKGGDKYEAKGTLNLRGVTKEIVVPFTVKITGKTAVAEGSAPVNRIDFGIRGHEPQYAGENPIPHTVNIVFSVKATK